jgi:hypothetical protein
MAAVASDLPMPEPSAADGVDLLPHPNR